MNAGCRRFFFLEYKDKDSTAPSSCTSPRHHTYCQPLVNCSRSIRTSLSSYHISDGKPPRTLHCITSHCIALAGQQGTAIRECLTCCPSLRSTAVEFCRVRVRPFVLRTKVIKLTSDNSTVRSSARYEIADLIFMFPVVNPVSVPVVRSRRASTMFFVCDTSVTIFI